MRATVFLCVTALVLAGCTENTPDDGPDTVEPTVIQGVVVDPSLAPIEGAKVVLANTGMTNVTGPEGSFRFTVEEGPGAPWSLQARMDGFKEAALQVPVNATVEQRTDLRIQMERADLEEGYLQHLPFNGFIACSALVAAGHNHGGNAHEDDDVDCGADASSEDVWEFEVDPDLQNAVIEVAWDADLTAAEYLSMTIEGVGVDDGDDRRFFFTEGTSPLRGTLSRLQSNVFFAEDGGTVRVSVQVAGPESDVVASAAVNQEFKIIASLFYVEPGSRDYSVVSG